MQTTARRIGIILSFVLALLLVHPTTGHAAGRLSGDAYFSDTQCQDPPAGYEEFTDYLGLTLTGSLEGCWYTKIITDKTTPGGVYLERGEEVFEGSLNGGPVGTFTTTYKYQAKFDDSGAQQWGRCQHPIVTGSGTGGFEGARGRVNFRDIIGDVTTYVYKGHIHFK
jgi:hypothetical protein